MVQLSLIGTFAVTARLALAQTTTAAIFYPFDTFGQLEGYVDYEDASRTFYVLHCTDTLSGSDSQCTPTPITVIESEDTVEVTSSNLYISGETVITYTAVATCDLYGSGSSASAGCTVPAVWADGFTTPVSLPLPPATLILPPSPMTQTVNITPSPAPTTSALTTPSTSASGSGSGSGSTSAASTASTSTSTGGMPAVTGNAGLAMGGVAIAALAMLA